MHMRSYPAASEHPVDKGLPHCTMVIVTKPLLWKDSLAQQLFQPLGKLAKTTIIILGKPYPCCLSMIFGMPRCHHQLVLWARREDLTVPLFCGRIAEHALVY